MTFDTEADLCAAFIAAVPSEWVAYPETGGWDIVLSRKVDGFQIGIEAKLRLNAKVVSQCLDAYYSEATKAGPDCRAVLVPAKGVQADFGAICDHLGIVVIRCFSESQRGFGYGAFSPKLPAAPGARSHDWLAARDWPEWMPTKRLKLPAYVPDVTAGAPSPLQLTEWKIKAIKLSIIMEKRGYVTREDFKHLQLNHRLWLPSGNGWVRCTLKGYERGERWPELKKAHPKAWKAIAADYNQWAPKQAALI